MIETVKKEWQAKVAVILFLILTIWWLILRFISQPGDLNQQLFAAIYGVMAAWGGFWGLKISQKWGGIKSVMGKAITMFSLGLFAQEFGQLAYSFYIYYLKIDVPYPSLGDVGYFASIPFYIYGVLLLAKASGIKVSLRSFKNKLQAILIPVGILILAYYLFLQGYEFDWSKPLTIFLDFGYPMGQAIYISLAILTYYLSRNVLGGIMKSKILFILFALLAQFISDFTFLYQASKEIWYAGGINDYSYLVSYLLMTLGLLQFETVLTKLRNMAK